MIKIRSLSKTIKSHWFIALISFIITVALINLLAFVLVKPYYSSDVDLISVSQSKSADSSKIIKTYQSFIKTPIILSPIHQQLAQQKGYSESVSDLGKRINITADEDSQVFTITATSNTAKDARLIANQTATILQKESPELINPSNLKRLTIGKTAVYKHTSNRWIVITLSILSGLLVAIIMVIWRDLVSKKVTKADLLSSSSLPLIGTIKIDKTNKA
ncbi:hypothetical protein LOOC260_102780 [Paucilactobacillus hokkaidonensis JCM 18461]|uniref:Capsular polysaccharide biosynthesis protein CpsC n=2 Tax=Paucilactobacillus hokkaidonensis TaxID=1193095 RepID=A0A0A1GWR6_9LACO|nr:hypothetical protein [Paucilactobacillus hokkaidonensis]KRO09350.1 hypothetical protein IV59_GL000688 [Paucilactobacillus hokkaidonensis]BAP84856.1 hypothetical protein LOOC260_102780 [Paucilactobacillus hokkaidonensis JCM 18461]